MLVDATGRFVSQREEPRLCLVDVALEGGGYTLRTEAGCVWIPERYEGPRVPVRIWGGAVEACVHDEGTRLLSSWLGRPVRLVRFWEGATRRTDQGNGEVAFADGYPYLLASEASLADLNGRLEGPPLSMDRFRPNLVVEGGRPYQEDRWGGLRIGGIGFRCVKPCERCVVTTIDPETASKGREPLRTLASYRRWNGKVWFGVNLCPDAEGVLRVGDPLSPRQRAAQP